MNGVDYNYCKDTGIHYCCGVCNNFSTCLQTLHYKICRENFQYPRQNNRQQYIITKGFYNLTIRQFIGQPSIQFDYQSQFFPTVTNCMLPNIFTGS